MADYNRFVSYIYLYERGAKTVNSGFAKVDSRDRQCRVNLSLKNMYQDSPTVYKVYMFIRKDDKLVGIYLGNLDVQNNSGNFELVTDPDDIEGTGYTLDQVAGMIIRGDKGKMYGTRWDDEDMDTNQFMTLEDFKMRPPKVVNAASSELETADAVANEPETAYAAANEPETAKQDARQQRWAWQSSAQINPKAAGSIYQPMINESFIKEEGTWEGMESPPPSRSAGDNEADFEPTAGPMQAEVVMETPEVLTEMSGEEEAAMAMAVSEEPEMISELFHSMEGTATLDEALEMAAAVESPPPLWSAGMEAEQEQNPELKAPRPYGRRETAEASFMQTEEVKATASLQAPRRISSIENALMKGLRMYPFEDSEVTQCIRMDPQDIGLLPMQYWILANNSFLLHGYYSYRHLILAKRRDGRYILGIPGVNSSREEFMAEMFGFRKFKPVRAHTAQTCEFGYWYIVLE